MLMALVRREMIVVALGERELGQRPAATRGAAPTISLLRVNLGIAKP
jgi:hypothetical protein